MPKPVKEFEVHPYVQFMTDKYSPYRKWIESEEIPIVSGSYVADVRTLELEEWKRRGAKGAYLSFSDQLVADGYVCEIAPGKSVNPHQQLYEEPPQRYDWHEQRGPSVNALPVSEPFAIWQLE